MHKVQRNVSKSSCSVSYCHLTLTEIGMYWQNLVKPTNVKFNTIFSAVLKLFQAYEQMDGWTHRAILTGVPSGCEHT